MVINISITNKNLLSLKMLHKFLSLDLKNPVVCSLQEMLFIPKVRN